MSQLERTVGIYTLGCKVNQYESEAIAEGLVSRGFSVVPFSRAFPPLFSPVCGQTVAAR